MRLVIKAWRKLENVPKDSSDLSTGPRPCEEPERERERKRDGHVEHSLIAANFVNYRRRNAAPTNSGALHFV